MAFPDDWGRKVVITIQASLADSNLSYFPVLITQSCLPNEVVDSDEANKAQSDGGDLRFYSGDYSASDPASENTDRLPCEIVDFTQHSTPGSATVEIWVRVPSINSSTGAMITMYYNATGKSQPAVGATYGRDEVWDENGSDNYKMVHHFTGANAADLDDSTGTGNDITGDNGSPGYDASALIGNGVDFVSGSNEYLTVADSADVDIAVANVTISQWFKLDSLTDGCILLNKKDLWSHNDGYTVEMEYESSELRLMITGSGTNQARSVDLTSYLDTTDYHQFVIKISSTTTIAFFVDGTDRSDDTSIDQLSGNALTLNLGGYVFYDIYSDFTFDELRYAHAARDTDWIEAEYRNGSLPATYVVEGTPADVAPSGTTVTLSGTIPGVATTSATSLLRMRSALGNLAAVASMASSPINRDRPIAGSFASVFSLTASLKRLKKLGGSFASASSLSSTISRLRSVTGALAVASAVSGGVLKRTRKVLASLSVISSFSGKYINRERGVSASLAAAATFSAEALKRSRIVSGSLAAVSTFSGAMTSVAAAAYSGVINAVSSLSGTLKRSRNVTGSLAGSGNLTATIKRLRGVNAVLSATSSLSASIKRLRIFKASLAAVSTVVGALKVAGVGGAKALAGTISAVSSLSSTIRVIARLQDVFIQGINQTTGKMITMSSAKIRFKKEK